MKKDGGRRFKIIIAPNSFKGSLSSIDAADAIALGLERSGLPCSYVKFPVADGGSDTMQVLTQLLTGGFVETKVSGPLGHDVQCRYGWVAEKSLAVVGLSEASGIHLISSNNVMHANTYGTGQQIAHALEHGASTVVLGVGGSATTDGGSGILRALGFKFYDAAGKEITQLPQGLIDLHTVKLPVESPSERCSFIVLCDVENPLLGTAGAATVYGPQKGATPGEVQQLERCLARWAAVAKRETGVDITNLKYGGAAGGASAGLHAWLGATLTSGIDYLLSELNFDAAVAGADYVVTGEGQLDSQTLQGKGPYSVAVHAKRAGAKVVAFAGSIRDREMLACFDDIITINHSNDIRVEMMRTRQNLTAAVEGWAREVMREGV